MNFTGNLTDTLGWTLLHFVWQGALVALLLALTEEVLRKASAQARYAAACGAMLLMLACALGTFAWLYPDSASSAARVAPAPATVAATRGPVMDAAVAPSATVRLSDYLPLLVYFWFAGVCSLAIHALGGWVVVQRLKRRASRPVDGVWEARLARLANRLGIARAVSLRESALAEVPAVIGWLRPVVLLPGSALTGLSPQQLEALLAHELAHIRRHDYLVNLLQTAVETLLFYHPAVWWVGRKIRAERENCCDDLAVEVCGDALVYARALAQLEQLRGGMPQLAMASNRGSLLHRIQRLISAGPAAGATHSVRHRASGRLTAWHGAVPVLLCVAALWVTPYLSVQNGFSQQPAPVATPTPPAASVHPAKVAAPAPAPPATTLAAPVPAPAVPSPVPTHPVPAPAAAPGPPAPVPSPARPRPAPVLAAAVRAGIREGIREGVMGGVHAGVRGGVIDGVSEGVVGGVSEGVADGVVDGVMSGVSEGVIGGVREGVREGVRAGVLYAAAAVLQAAQATAGAAAEPSAEAKQGGFIDGLAAAGYRDLSVDELIRLKTHGVTPEYARQVQAAGLKPTAEELVKLRIHDVTPEFIAESKAAGLNLTMEQLLKFRIHGVDMAAVKEMAALGYNLSPDQMVKMHVHGLTPGLARELKQLGFGDPSFEQLIKMQIHGVTPEFAAAVKQAGLQDLSLERLVKFRIHGVDPEQIREIRALGFADLSADDAIDLQIHGVTPAFIREVQRRGLKDLSLEKIIKLKQLGILEEPAFI